MKIRILLWVLLLLNFFSLESSGRTSKIEDFLGLQLSDYSKYDSLNHKQITGVQVDSVLLNSAVKWPKNFKGSVFTKISIADIPKFDPSLLAEGSQCIIKSVKDMEQAFCNFKSQGYNSLKLYYLKPGSKKEETVFYDRYGLPLSINTFDVPLDYINSLGIFYKTFGEERRRYHPKSIVQLANGSYFVGGFVENRNETDSGWDDENAFYLCYDSLGNVIWNSEFGSNGTYEEITNVKLIDNKIIACGFGTYTNKKHFGFLMQISEKGKIEWQNKIGNESDDCEITDFVSESSGGFLLTGGISTNLKDPWKIYCVKISKTGNVEWEKRWGTKNYFGEKIIGIGKQGYIITAYSDGYTKANDFESILLKINSDGVLLKQNSLISNDGNWSFNIESVFYDAQSSKIFITGNKQIRNSTTVSLFFIRLDQELTIEKNIVFDYKWTSSGNSMCQFRNGDLLISGEMYGQGYLDDHFLMRITQDGEIVWKKTFGGLRDDEIYSSILNNREEIIFTGKSEGSYAIRTGQLVIGKTTPEGFTIIPQQYLQNSLEIKEEWNRESWVAALQSAPSAIDQSNAYTNFLNNPNALTFRCNKYIK